MIEDNLKLFKNTWVRKDKKIDHDMVNDCRKNYKQIQLTQNSVVLDLGANIGGFAAMCKEADVAEYRAVEPNDDNIDVLMHNVKNINKLLCGAVSASYDEFVIFYIRASKSAPASSSIVPKRIDKSLTKQYVKNYSIDALMREIKPDVLKMDIEGAEKQIIEHWKGIVPDCVKQFALEIHSADYISFFEAHYHPMFLDQGFHLVTSAPADGFDNKGSTWSHFGVTKNSCLFGYDLLYARP